MTGADFRHKGTRDPARLAAATFALALLTLFTLACNEKQRDSPQEPPACADVNGDGGVDASDVQILETGYGSRQGDPSYDAVYDLNHDGVIDETDISLAGNQFGKACTR